MEHVNMRYDQPYQAALCETTVLLEAHRWHMLIKTAR